jgi:diguanylate cyclase (GGDEF)-like protein
MAAITLTPDPSAHVPSHLLSSGMLGLAVVMVLGLVVAGGLGAVLIEGGASQSAMDRIRRLADAAYEGIVVVRENRIHDANTAFCELVGAPLEALSARAFEGELVTFDADAADGYERRREGWLRPQGGGRPIPVEVFGRILEEEDGEPSGDLVVLALRDLRERRSAEEKIRFLAEHDGLTGLSNRNAMQTRLAALIDRTAASGENLALIYVDLDHFKEANDLHGHLAGDAILVEVAQRLKATVAAPSFAARLGGDEFVVAHVIGGPQAIAAAGDFATHLSAVLAEPVVFEGQTLAIGASLGVSLYPDDGRTPEALMVNADMALYRAKAAGRGGHAFFKREMDETVRERRNLTRELRNAVADGQLVVHYQPLARVDDNEILGFEALVRWNHPERGMIPPLDFIPLAEENGLIVPLGEWVLRQACADAAAWERPLRIAVNLSPLQLHQTNLPNVVHEVLIETGLAPDRLELEITETALYKDYQRALDNLRRLKAIGVRIAMDDFGTGFSSLATLHSFPFDKLKIDRSFIENMNRHERATVIVRAVLGLGRSLNIPVTAEGVETFEQLEFLRDEACAEVQGYCIGRPTPLENLFVWTAAAAARLPRLPLRSVKR